MKTLSFWQGALLAFTASMLGSIGYFALAGLFVSDCGIRLVISGLAYAYGWYLLSSSPQRTGRITLMLLCNGGLVIIWQYYPSLIWFVIWHVLAIWLIRSLYYHAGLMAWLADLGLSLLALAAAFWALHHTGSLFLSIWCFFLAQALFVLIPGQSPLKHAASSDSAADFKRAYHTAEAAVRKLSSQA